MLVNKTKLGLGVASAAVAIGMASPSQAACVVSGSTVVCEDDNVVDTEVNPDVASVAGDDVTLQVVDGATVEQPGSTVTAPQQGAVAIDNAGTFGEESAPVGIDYTGTQGLGTNSFSLTNGGTITGGVDIEDVGSTVSIVNSDEIATETGGLDVEADGDITVNNTGAVGSDSNAAGIEARSRSATFNSSSSTVAGVTTTTSTIGEVGSAVEVEIGDDGSVFGSVQADGANGASVANEGSVVGDVAASAGEFGLTSVSTSSATTITSDVARTITAADAVISNAADALIGTDPNVPVSVTAQASGTASVDNAGRINGDVSVDAQRADAEDTEEDSTVSETVGTTTTVTVVDNESDSETSTGGDGVFSNAQGGLITGDVDVSGAGSATVDNQGAVIGTTDATSQALDTSNSDEETTVTTTNADGSGTVVTTTSGSSSTAESGGDVTGTYAGTNGALQFAPFGGASDGTVTQSANGDSSATVTGTIFGDFNGTASANTSSSETTSERTVTDAAGGVIQSDVSSSTTTTEDSYGNSSSSLVVDGGSITAVGSLSGEVGLFADGDVTATLANGASVSGDVDLETRYQSSTSATRQEDESTSYDGAGAFESTVTTVEVTRTSAAGTGNVSSDIGDATVGGSVDQFGAAGQNSFALAEEGDVSGSVGLENYGYSTSTNELTETETLAGGDITRSRTYDISELAEGGDVSADVAGTIGGDLDSSTNAGSVSVALTGQIGNDIDLSATGQNYDFAESETRVNSSRTAYEASSSVTNVGGTASLDVDAESLSAPASLGGISVAGFGGSTVSIGENSSVLAASSSDALEVGDNYTDTTFTRESVYESPGVEDSRTTTYSTTNVGGDASLINDGQIGADELSPPDAVEVTSITNAEVENNGSIFGGVAVNSLSEDTQSTTESVNIDDVTQTDTTDTVYTAVGGNASLNNAGRITNGASVAAASGTVTNDGELYGGLALGDSVDNYTTQQVDTFSELGSETVVATADPFVQDYTVEQNGILEGGIFVDGAFGSVADVDGDVVQTSDINAVINLNDGSTTSGTILAEYDASSGDRFTNTTVNMNGSGTVGDEDSRVLGVETLAKTGDGTFLLTGAEYAAPTTGAPLADYTLDVGQLAISGGELQLDTVDTVGDEVFGIRGDILNEGTLVLGNRVTVPAALFGIEGDLEVVDGTDVYQVGNFTQTEDGALALGITPTLVRTGPSAFGGSSVSNNPLGYQQLLLSSGLFTTPEAAGVDVDSGSLRIDGDLDLSGQVQLVAPVSGLFLGGETIDIASVSGTVTEDADVVAGSPSNFVTYELETRDEGGRTIVYVEAGRNGYDTVALNDNASAAGNALNRAMPAVISRIQAGTLGAIGVGSEDFMYSQDLANVMVAFDTLLTTDQAAAVLNDLASGDIYGSLAAVRTTSPFVDAVSNRRLPAGAKGFNAWIQPAAQFGSFDGDSDVGSNGFDADTYGGAAGFGYANGKGEFGIGFGYGEVDADADDRPIKASANTWMLGVYAHQAFDQITISGDMVYGWSKWDVTREMPTLSRTADAEFDSTEFRASLRAEYRYDLGSAYLAPFAKLELRSFDFDGFEEEGAGAVGLAVDSSDGSVFTPSLGLKVGTSFDAGETKIRPEASIAYNFAGDAETDRDVAYLGAKNVGFTLQGVDPEGYVSLKAGLYGEIGPNSGAYISGGYATGGDAEAAQIRGGVVFGF